MCYDPEFEKYGVPSLPGSVNVFLDGVTQRWQTLIRHFIETVKHTEEDVILCTLQEGWGQICLVY